MLPKQELEREQEHEQAAECEDQLCNVTGMIPNSWQDPQRIALDTVGGDSPASRAQEDHDQLDGKLFEADSVYCIDPRYSTLIVIFACDDATVIDVGLVPCSGLHSCFSHAIRTEPYLAPDLV